MAPATLASVGMYEAESGVLGGTAVIVGAADGSSRSVGDLAGEASGRQAVTLVMAGDSVSFTVKAAQAGASGFIVRYSIPDAPTGGGTTSTLEVITTTSRYSWLYGAASYRTKLCNVPANATTYEKAATPTHLYDELQLQMSTSILEGDVVRITLPKNATTTTIDFIELEVVPEAIAQPAGFVS